MELIRDFYRNNMEIVVFACAMLLVGAVTLEVLALTPRPEPPHIIYDCAEPLPAVADPSPTAFPEQWAWPIAESTVVESEPQVVRPVIVKEEDPKVVHLQEDEAPRRHRRHHRRWR